MSKKNKLRIIPLGGLGEVGKNMMAYEFGNDIIVVDAGIMFPKNDMLGVDYIIPDFEPFEGYLGMAGATGDCNQNHIIHSIKIEDITGICTLPPATATRNIANESRTDDLALFAPERSAANAALPVRRRQGIQGRQRMVRADGFARRVCPPVA